MIDPDIGRLRKQINELLRERRPDRYIVRDTSEDDTGDIPDLDPLLDPEAVLDGDGTAWLDDIAAEVAHLVPETEIRRLYARKVVGQQEGGATRRANGLLRKIARTRQLVLGWWGSEDDPVAVTTRVVLRGQRPRVKEERVALRAMSPNDFRLFAIEERRRAAKDHAARNEACAGAEWVADQMAQGGFALFIDWARATQPPPDEDNADAAEGDVA